MLTQFSLGVYLKLHIHEKTLRPYIVPFHGVIGKVWPILGWCQVSISTRTSGIHRLCVVQQLSNLTLLTSRYVNYRCSSELSPSEVTAWAKKQGNVSHTT